MRKISALALSIFSILLMLSPESAKAWSAFSCLNGPLTNLPDSTYRQVSDCGQTAGLCLDIAVVDISNFQIFDNAAPYANGIAGCDFDSLRVYPYGGLTGQGVIGPYLLKQWRVDGSSFSTPFNDVNELVDSMNVWDPTGNWQNDAGAQRIIGGTSGRTYSDMTIFVNATALDEFLTVAPFISPKGTELQFAVGTHEIVLVETSTLVRDTLFLSVHCIQPDTLRPILLVNETDSACLDWSQLSLPPDNVFLECQPTGGTLIFELTLGDSCIDLQGLRPGTDSACYVSCDSRGLCDTTYIYATVQSAVGMRTFRDTIVENELKTHCLATNIFLGAADTMYNSCADLSGNFVAFNLQQSSFCIDYSSRTPGGTEEACIILCDTDANECDTTMMFITVLRTGAQQLEDSIFVNQIDSFCDWDLMNLTAPLDTIINFCEDSSGEFVEFTIDPNTLCLEYQGIDVGIDTACLLLVDTDGMVDTAFFTVETKLPAIRFITDTIRPGLIVDYCLDTTELGGQLLDSIFICNDFQGRAIAFDANTANFCLEVEGQFPGTDTICAVICDEFNVCDTTILSITVSPIPGLPPLAVDDVDTTRRDQAITINLLANDDIPDLDPNNFRFYILPVNQGGAGPTNGIVIPNSNGTVQYVPDSSFCGSSDLFDYVVCNRVACDTARVEVFVECPSNELHFFSGFSPNNDGVNDTFVIEGIENYPEHTLYVYNRWGNQVLKTTLYQNDWDGTWNGVDLPDGTYFYVFETGEGEAESGFVVIAR
ncbi:MAG: gliding motility-associated C-terminal domain-containing protein [Bacteroidota bacterium]